MKTIAFLVVLATVFACNNDKSSTALVKSAESKTAKVKRPGVMIPDVKYGIEGFYTGFFKPEKYDENREIFYNKITICIDSLDENMIYGYSVVAGNERPFSGSYTNAHGHYVVSVKEPGDNKYDGSFEFTVSKPGKLTGLWKANDTKLPVPERSYELESRHYRYDPSLQLPEEINEDVVYGTFNEKTQKGERLTSDAWNKNASIELLKSSDVENMYKGDLEVLRNSIYARHGYSFKNLRMRTLFDTYADWYMPVTTDVTALLTDIEKKNIELIKRYEKHATKYYDEFGR